MSLYRILGRICKGQLRCFINSRAVHESSGQSELDNVQAGGETESDNDISHVPGAMRRKYVEYRDEDSLEILDVEEEKQRYIQEIKAPLTVNEIYKDYNLQRGVSGVFDIEELVDVLRKERAIDIFVCTVPAELAYVEYMVICSGNNFRHMLAMAEFVRKLYKIKHRPEDILPRIEGKESRKWMALDLGNIAVHIFNTTARITYDLESLWAIGSRYDRECNKPKDSVEELFNISSVFESQQKSNFT